MIERRLKEIAQRCGLEYMKGPEDQEITDVHYDSRKIIAGALFVAVKGAVSDGHDFIEKAVARGASVIVVEEESDFSLPEGVSLYRSSDTRYALSHISSVFFGEPSKKLSIIGVTGTNGKTSFTYMVESILTSLGYKTGVMGTINYRWPGEEIPAPNTTPESRDLQEMLYRMAVDGVEQVVMEISSHALVLGRVDHVHVDCGVFTNLTGDHLDFHDGMEDYYQAKKLLFGRAQGKKSVVFTDDQYGSRLARELAAEGIEVVTCGTGDDDFVIDEKSIVNDIDGIGYSVAYEGRDYEVSLPIAGRFSVYNSLVVLVALTILGYRIDAVIEKMKVIPHVPGRFDVQHSSRGFDVVVDYAHTGDALLKLLQSVNELNHKRVIALFGCGGDRDRGKRPVMGKAASENSDVTIVTSDNPRTEDPDAIIRDILTGVEKEVVVEPDRLRAITYAISIAEEGDIVVVAGKGHEDYQIIGREKTHFDDREIVAGLI